MRVEIGKTYRNGWGQVRKIMGHAKAEPVEGELVYWSLQGDWYTESGRKTVGDQARWHKDGGPHDLQQEVGE